MWIRLFNILYRKHKSWMRQQGTPPTWDRDKVRIESDDVSPKRRKILFFKKKAWCSRRLPRQLAQGAK